MSVFRKPDLSMYVEEVHAVQLPTSVDRNSGLL